MHWQSYCIAVVFGLQDTGLFEQHEHLLIDAEPLV
jgi:hypothetical protein